MDVKMADRLVELRKKHGLSQEELADKLNISRQAVSKWERAESAPDTDNLIALSKLYNTSIDEMLNCEMIGSANRTNNEWHSSIIVFPFNRKKALKIVSIVFLSIGILFVLIGSGFFLGFAVPEVRDMELAQNENIVPINAEVTEKEKTGINNNSEMQYKVVFTWSEGETERTGKSNAVYSELEANELIGKTIQIRVDGDRAVMVDYQWSALAIIGFVFIGVFGGIGIVFTATSVLIYVLNKEHTTIWDRENLME